MGIRSEQLRKKLDSHRPVKKRSKYRLNNKKFWSKRKGESKESRITSKLWGELHHDLPRKILIALITFLMIYFTAQVNQPWSNEIIDFIRRMTTQQPNYSEWFEEVVHETDILDELEILPVFEEENREIFAP